MGEKHHPLGMQGLTSDTATRRTAAGTPRGHIEIEFYLCSYSHRKSIFDPNSAAAFKNMHPAVFHSRNIIIDTAIFRRQFLRFDIIRYDRNDFIFIEIMKLVNVIKDRFYSIN